MKFLDLNTGYSFDALWTSTSTKGYTFWFPNEQSIDITYAMPICILTESDESLELKITDGDVFKFISHNGEEIDVDGYKFDTPQYSNIITTTPENIGNYYAHLFYVSCKSSSIGEHICRINIDGHGFIRVGADFYGEHEPAFINLSNMGVELPDSIQKAIYDSNVHEDYKDNILMNRKYKELLSNYWDIVANRGSYKSLKNSLDWFEWGDNLDIKEIWKYYNVDREFFFDKELMTILDDKVNKYFNSFSKTTYVSLYCSTNHTTDTYDDEFNPILAKTAMKWSKNDIMLKMSLLAQFFGHFFLPIHLSILHATVEDKVFTNAVKVKYGTNIIRNDEFGEFTYVESNIKDTDIFKITNVNAQVTNNTIYGVPYYINDCNCNYWEDYWEDYYEDCTCRNLYFGVDEFPSNGLVTDNNIKTFSQQFYTGPGVIVPISLKINNINADPFIKQTIVDYNELNERLYFNDIINDSNDEKSFNINFNVLVKEPGEKIIDMCFITSNSRTINRRIKFTVEDTDNVIINMYKIKHKDNTRLFDYNDFMDTTVYKYLYKIQDNASNTNYYDLKLPIFKDCIQLNRTVVFDVKGRDQDYIRNIISIMSDYLEFVRYELVNNVPTERIHYLVFVSKKFYADLPLEASDYSPIRDELGFYPQFHYLEKIEGDTLADYTVNKNEAICCAVEIDNGNEVIPFRYGKSITEAEWTYTNKTTGEVIAYPVSSIQPFITGRDGLLENGYYDITFKYRLANNENEKTLNSSLLVKS